MTESDPFADPAFLSRLQKLLPLLASGQAGEADAARRKLLEHLASARLSLSDVSRRLGSAPRQGSFLEGARDIGMQRQLGIARQARHEAEAEAAAARVRVAELSALLQQASLSTAGALQGRANSRAVTVLALCVAAISLAVAAGARLGGPGQEVPVRGLHAVSRDPTLLLRPGERAGTVLVADLAVHYTPSDNALVRAFLTRGTPVVLMQEQRIGPQTWLLIRSDSGEGWVRGGDVLH